MKFTNELDNLNNFVELKKTLVKWVLGSDGENGATCRILDAIPWTDEMESVIPWSDFDEKIDFAIGGRGDWAQKVYDLVNPLETGLRANFNNFISEKATKIYGVYATMIDALNKKLVKKCVLRKLVGIDSRGICQYKIVREFGADTYLDSINKMWDYCKINGIHCDWDFNKLVDALYVSNTSVCVSPKFYTQLIK